MLELKLTCSSRLGVMAQDAALSRWHAWPQHPSFRSTMLTSGNSLGILWLHKGRMLRCPGCVWTAWLEGCKPWCVLQMCPSSFKILCWAAGELPDQGVPPQHQQQWQHLSGHPERAVESGADGVKGGLVPVCGARLTCRLRSWRAASLARAARPAELWLALMPASN